MLVPLITMGSVPEYFFFYTRGYHIRMLVRLCGKNNRKRQADKVIRLVFLALFFFCSVRHTGSVLPSKDILSRTKDIPSHTNKENAINVGGANKFSATPSRIRHTLEQLLQLL